MNVWAVVLGQLIGATIGALVVVGVVLPIWRWRNKRKLREANREIDHRLGYCHRHGECRWCEAKAVDGA